MEKNSKTKTGKLSSDQLRDALYAFHDISERLAQCPYMPLKSTARDTSKNPDNKLEGDAIYVGIKDNEWTKSRRSLFEMIAKYLKFEYVETDKGYEFELNGVPVYMSIIKRKYKFFDKPNIVFWGVIELLMPNSIDSYLKSQHLVR